MRYTKLFARFSLIVVVLLIAACSDTASDSTNPDVGPATLIPAPPLDAPLDLTISTNNGAVTLSWSEVAAKNDNDIPGYNIYWNKTGNVTNANTIIENVLSPHIVEGLTVGETYYFVVTARDSNEESKPSFEIFATMPLPVLVSINLEPVNPSIVSGTSIKFTASGKYSDGSFADISSSVIWMSEDTSSATIDNDNNKGLATADIIGTTTITATDHISNIVGKTTLRTQLDHAILGNPVPACQSSGCHTLPADHIKTTVICTACHISTEPLNWTTIFYFDHKQVTQATCISCHDGLTAAQKSTIHLPTTDLCEACHVTGSWIPVFSVDHNETLGPCVFCHDGINASGKTPSHIPSSDQCEKCHQLPDIAPWPIVAPDAVDHTQVLGTCIDCHNGVVAAGKSALHISSSDTCNDCHSISTWTIP